MPPQTQENEVIHTSKDVMSIQRDFDSILSEIQEANAIRQVKDCMAPEESSGFVTLDTYLPNHYEKIEDIFKVPGAELRSRLDEAVSDSFAFDTDKMTRLEIYNRVESIFAEYLGKNFLEPAIIYGGGLGTLAPADDEFPINTYQSIRLDYNTTLRRLGITVGEDGNYDPSVLIEGKGFSGMTEDEMYTAIRNQYPDNMSLKDSIFMSYELGRLRLGEGTAYGRVTVENILDTLNANSGVYCNTSAGAMRAKKIFDTMLELPASYEGMVESVESFRLPNGNLRFGHNVTTSKDEILQELLKWFGGDKLYGTDMAYKLMEML